MSSLSSFITNIGVRNNANPTGLTIEQITSDGIAYKDYLVRHKTDNYRNRHHRYEVATTDPVATVYTERFFEFITSKKFKSYLPEEDEEGMPVEVLIDVWQKWEDLNLNECFREIGKYMVSDGYCLNEMYLYPDPYTGDMRIGYHNYGHFQCPPAFWEKWNLPGTPYHNLLKYYHVSYIPIPQGSAGYSTYRDHAITKNILPDDEGFHHFTRLRWNHGVGVSGLQKRWASITKLRNVSWYDYKGACRLPILEIPDDMDPDDADALANAWRYWDIHNIMVLPKRVNRAGETEDFPRIFERSPDQTGPTAKSGAEGQGLLGRNAEYGRLQLVDGLSETYFVGAQPGQLESSKMDLTRDDRTMISEFNLYVPVLKALLKWLMEIGAFAELEGESQELIMAGQYEIKTHVEWEVLENQMAEAEMLEAENDMKAEGAQAEGDRANALQTCPDCKKSMRMRPRTKKGKNYYVCPNCGTSFYEGGKADRGVYNESLRMNSAVEVQLLYHIRINAAMPMTPVMSSWIKAIGYEDGNIYMQTHDKTAQGIDTYEYAVGDAMGVYNPWIDSGSKGGYWWDNIRDKVSPANKLRKPPSQLQTGFGAQFKPEETRKAKIEGIPELGVIGAGETREPFGVSPAKKTDTTQPAAKRTKTPSSGPAKMSPRAKPSSKAPAKSKGIKEPKAWAKSAATKNSIDISSMSLKRLNEFLTNAGIESIGKKTYLKWKSAMSYSQFRFNSFGNVMNFDIPLHYHQNGHIVQEYACKREFKKIENHSGDLVIYESLGHSGPMYKLGTYDYWWDDENGLPMAKFNYNDPTMVELLDLVPEDSEIANRIKNGKQPEMSTEYFVGTPLIRNERTYQTNIHNDHGESKFMRIAIVNKGNCGDPFCKFEGDKD